MTTYINMKGDYGIETIDEYTTHKEANLMLKEYKISDKTNHYYISQRCTQEWKEK